MPDSARSLRYVTGNLPRLDGEKTVESFVDGISNLIGFYFVLGSMLGHGSGLLNIAAGVTLGPYSRILTTSLSCINYYFRGGT